MTSQLHEVLVAIFREYPEVARALIEHGRGKSFDASLRASPVAEALSDVTPATYQADVVYELRDENGSDPVCGIVFEVQLAIDAQKRLTWPAYQVNLRRRLGCPTMMVVFTPHAAVARWAAKPIVIDPYGECVMRMVVIGPEQIPQLVDHAHARRYPELAVLAAVAHGHGERAAEIGEIALRACAHLDESRSALYTDLVYYSLSQAARTILEQAMHIPNYQYQSEFARKYFFAGKAEGKVDALLLVLEARGFSVDATIRTRLEALETDKLDLAVRAAATVEAIDDLFET